MRKIISTINYLIRKQDCDKDVETNTKPIIKKLLNSPSIDRTEFEFSLRIRKDKIFNSLRFVNFDNHSNSNIIQYRRRINLIKNIIFPYFKGKRVVRFFEKIREFDNFRLPLYFGLEAKGEERNFKIYLNFSHIKNELIYKDISKNILSHLGCNPTFKNRRFPLIGIDFGHLGEIRYKLYYLYNKGSERWYLNKYCFSEREKKIFNFLNKFNKNDYFVISERYTNDKCFSKKIEVGIRDDIDYERFIRVLCKIDGCYSSGRKVMEIAKRIKGKINVVIIEKQLLTIYIRIPTISNVKY